MSKIIGIIAEDKSDIEVINELIAKHLKKSNFTIKHFVGNGCGKLKQKCSSWSDNLIKRGCHHIMIFHDLDRCNEKALRTEIESKVSKEKFPNSIVVIPIQELEAWLLSDLNAIKEVFKFDETPKKTLHCETIDSPKEYLAKLVHRISKKRYINTIHNKKIAEKIDINNLSHCASYAPFDAYMKKIK